MGDTTQICIQPLLSSQNFRTKWVTQNTENACVDIRLKQDICLEVKYTAPYPRSNAMWHPTKLFKLDSTTPTKLVSRTEKQSIRRFG